ncbi:MAG: hypothetical protein J6Q81_08830, partial [Lentisphaeria bacterium]|nr:hypothetical protein [Lentisphaeria bacterium]
PAILRVIIESCDTAAQAVEKLKEILKSGDYWHWKNGSIFFFCDPQEGYVCEMTAKDITVVRYDNGYTVRANIWLNPGMQKFARNGIKGYLNSAGRMFTVISRLNKALDKTGKISVAECIATSRNYKMPAKVHDKRSVCGNHTNSAATFEIDKEYPAVLSTAYFTTGHPLHTICVPVPVCAEKLHPAMGDLSWAKAAFARRDKLKLKDIPPEWAKFEQEHMATYNAAKDQARKLLAKGKRTEAVKMLNDTAWKIWEEAAEKLSL